MLNSKGFDLWAADYDKSVGVADEDNRYPFAGYKEILNKIYNIVLTKEKPKVLDIGFGTAVLTTKLYEMGCQIWGQDFSPEMIKIAKAKMPEAHLYEGDFALGLNSEILNNSYDFIIATYSLHHLTDDKKTAFILANKKLLKDGGMIIIGDVAFADRKALEVCKNKAADYWDEDEFYFVFDELSQQLSDVKFDKISHCAGIITLSK